LSLPLDQFDVSVAPGREARLLATRPDPAEAARWTLRDLDVGPGYKAALAVEGAGWRLKVWDWPVGLCSLDAGNGIDSAENAPLFHRA
jgi:4'-phosphopantetheinyl transferase